MFKGVWMKHMQVLMCILCMIELEQATTSAYLYFSVVGEMEIWVMSFSLSQLSNMIEELYSCNTATAGVQGHLISCQHSTQSRCAPLSCVMMFYSYAVWQ